jgi:hypothetical protein
MVGELEVMSCLVDALARHVADGGVAPSVRDALAADLALLGALGAQRLRHLTGVAAPAVDAGHVQSGAELRSLLVRLSGRSAARPATSRRLSTVQACAALVEAVLAASRYAARAA